MKIFGEYTTSLYKALFDIDDGWATYKGLIVAGTHNPLKFDIELILEAIKNARENEIPYLGICWGHQLACIEYARNVLKIKDATSEEFGERGNYVVKKRKEGLKVGVHNGESYWHNYEPDIIWRVPDWFITSQFHPEYQSYIDKPNELLTKFVNLCKKNSGLAE